MTELAWQKSSFSGSGENDCLEVASVGAHGSLHLRESEEPGVVLDTSVTALRALLAVLKERS